MVVTQKISKNPRVPLIIDCALSILRDNGYGGLSMRQVAKSANISLSNLQFYFKNKDELLRGMIDFYFERCSTLFESHLRGLDSLEAAMKIRGIISFGLEGGEEINEICKIFRELWAISTRNEDVKEHLEDYYREYASSLSDLFSTVSVDADNIKNVTSLLLPYFEGYALMATVIPLEKVEVLEMLTALVVSELRISSPLSP